MLCTGFPTSSKDCPTLSRGYSSPVQVLSSSAIFTRPMIPSPPYSWAPRYTCPPQNIPPTAGPRCTCPPQNSHRRCFWPVLCFLTCAPVVTWYRFLHTLWSQFCANKFRIDYLCQEKIPFGCCWSNTPSLRSTSLYKQRYWRILHSRY